MMLAMGVLGGTPIQSWNTPSLTKTSPVSLVVQTDDEEEDYDENKENKKENKKLKV